MALQEKSQRGKPCETTAYDDEPKSSDLVQLGIGSAGGAKTRTSWDLTLTIGIPFSRWGAAPFVYSPIPFPAGIVEKLTCENKGRPEPAPRRPHPFELARMWRRQIENDPGLNQAKIAAREGISRARVTQIMDLLELPAEIQNGLLCPPAPLEMRSFPERRL